MSDKLCTGRFRDGSATELADEAGLKPWIHIVPAGEFPSTVDIPSGYNVEGYDGNFDEDTSVEGVTVFNAQVMERLVQGFEPDILMDYEHFSHDADKATEAAGWGQGLRYTANRDGLELQTDWAAPAAQKIRDKVYRFVSPEFSGAVRFEGGLFKFYPSALTGAGLTNRPKLKALRPVSANRDKKTPAMNYKSMLCKALGLPETATDAEIEAKMGSHATEQAESMNRATELTKLRTENKKLKDEAIEQDLETYADVIDDKEAAKEMLQLNRDTAVKVFQGARSKMGDGKGGERPLFQRNRAKAPDGDGKFQEGAKADEAATAKFRSIEARAHAIAAERKIPFGQAFDTAKAEAGA